jgi:hypothetical protein
VEPASGVSSRCRGLGLSASRLAPYPRRRSRLPDESPDTVGAESKLQRRVVVRRADVRTLVRPSQVVDGHPGQRHQSQDDAAERQIEEPAPRSHGGAQEVNEGERREHDEGGEHLHVERDADKGHGEQQDSPAAGLGRARQRPRGEKENQHEATLGVARAVDRDAHRCHREEESRQQPGRQAESALDQVVNEPHRGQAFQDLGHEDAETMEAEELDGGDLDPHRDRRLVHGEESGGVERVIQEVVPAGAHAPDAGGVVLVAEAVVVQAPQPEPCGQEEDRGKCQALEHGDRQHS